MFVILSFLNVYVLVVVAFKQYYTYCRYWWYNFQPSCSSYWHLVVVSRCLLELLNALLSVASVFLLDAFLGQFSVNGNELSSGSISLSFSGLGWASAQYWFESGWSGLAVSPGYALFPRVSKCE